MALTFGSRGDRAIVAYITLALAMGYILPFSNEWFNAFGAFKPYMPYLISMGLFMLIMQLKDGDI